MPLYPRLNVGLKLLDRHQLEGRHAERGQIWKLARDVEKGSAFARQVWSEKRSDMKLVDDEIVKRRRDEAAIMPGEVGTPEDAFARKRCLKLARVRIALRTFASVADDVEHVALAIAGATNESAPVPLLVACEQAGVAQLVVVEVPQHVNLAGVRRPYAKRRAVCHERRAHRRIRMNVLQRGSHEAVSQRAPLA